MSGSASLSQQKQETARAVTRTSGGIKSQNSAQANIQANPFYQVMFDDKLSPEQQEAAIRKLCAFTGSKEESRQFAKHAAEIKEYLQDARERMNTEIIKLTDTEAFAQLQGVYNDMNNALIDFDGKMKPLTDIISAVHTLRTQGLTFDTFKEIQKDREFEAENDRLLAAKIAEMSQIGDTITRLNGDIIALGEQKGFFGFGGVKESARIEISRKQDEIDNPETGLKTKQAAIQAEIDSLKALRREHESRTGEFGEQKAKLRELLDLTGDEHRERQTELVKAALHFVSTSKARIGEVREHIGAMNDQVENLFDANQHISRIYATLASAESNAEKDNIAIRAQYLPPSDGTEESLITKHTREENLLAIDEHIGALTEGNRDTVQTLADLTGQTIRIKSMRDANKAQESRVKTMQSMGVAGVADRLATVLQSVSMAALGESSAAAKDTLALMNASTNKVAQNQTLVNAMGIADQNQDLIRALEDLGTYGDAVKEATAISQQGIGEARGLLDQLKTLAETTKEDIGEAFAVHAEAVINPQVKQVSATKSSGSKSPFGI